jgi:hypothetical protein
MKRSYVWMLGGKVKIGFLVKRSVRRLVLKVKTSGEEAINLLLLTSGHSFRLSILPFS